MLTSSRPKRSLAPARARSARMSAIARVTVRVGDYKTDSSGGRGDGALELAALDDDPIALRSALWTATDQAYKSALAAYAQKQAALKQVQTPPQADDFSHEKPLISLAAPLTLTIDEDDWARRVARPAVSTGRIQRSARARAMWSIRLRSSRPRNHHLAGHERRNHCAEIGRGAIRSLCRGHTGAGWNAAGSLLCYNWEFAEGSRRAGCFREARAELIASLAELRKAPLVDEEYHGPLLLSADASSDTLRRLLAGGVTATRPRLGTEARTNGAFASSFHAQVMPENMDVVDDPLVKSYNGKGLVGAYDVDDEGVPAEAVTW